MKDTFKIRDLRRKGYFTVDNEAIDIMAKIIGVHAFIIYMVLCRHSDKNEESFPSQETIAEKTGMNKRTVLEKTKLLEQYNMLLIQKTRDEKTGEFLHNTYTLLDKSVWTTTTSGIQVQSDDTWVEAMPRCSETHTNNTKEKTNIEKISSKEKKTNESGKPNQGGNPQDLKLRPDFIANTNAKHANKAKKQPFGFTTSQRPQEILSRHAKGVAHGEHIF